MTSMLRTAAALDSSGLAVAEPHAVLEPTARKADTGPDPDRVRYIPGRVATVLAVVLSSYFFIACFSLYWLTFAAAALGALVVPRVLIQRAAPLWLVGSMGAMAYATQQIPGFFPDYTHGHQIAAEVGMWLALGFAARSYLAYTALPDTFDGLKATIAERWPDRWFAAVLLRPLDAIFTRIAIANTLVLAPLTVLLVLPATCNYLVLCAWGTIALLIQFPQDLMDHANIHNRIFTPRGDAPAGKVKVLRACQRYYENALCLMALQIPDYYRLQHNYVHHVEDNGPADSQTTLPYDRTSFIDFARHALVQGIDLVSGRQVFAYLSERNKTKQIAELKRAIAIWYGFLAIVAVINPLAAVAIFLSRFLGGNILSLFSFYQHGLVDEHDVLDVHGNSTNYEGNQHGNLGHDYHVEHHLRPGRHWADYYEQFAKAQGSEGGHKAVVVDKDAFGPLAFVAALWRKDYRAIAANAHLAGVDADDTATLEAIVKERTCSLDAAPRAGLAAKVDSLLGAVMARALPKTFHV